MNFQSQKDLRTAERRLPFECIALVLQGGGGDAVLRLTIWPGGETRQLAACDHHGRWIEWL